jgi:hypothetical protein
MAQYSRILLQCLQLLMELCKCLRQQLLFLFRVSCCWSGVLLAEHIDTVPAPACATRQHRRLADFPNRHAAASSRPFA